MFTISRMNINIIYHIIDVHSRLILLTEIDLLLQHANAIVLNKFHTDHDKPLFGMCYGITTDCLSQDVSNE